MTQTTDKNYMRKALKLAEKGIGGVEPNPAVGCVIVKRGQVIGKGWHEKFGGPHAEINALNDCRNLGANPRGAIMYVTLEPCSHIGKTGPCTRAIIDAKIAKVFMAMVDPSDHARGKGIEKLQQAGINVEVGLYERQAKLLNAPFIKFADTGKTWVILKWAQSIDGRLARQDKSYRWISSQRSRKDVQKLRSRAQAILVGIETVLADDPLLSIRVGKSNKKLTRIVMDSNLRIPADCQLVKTAREHPLMIVTYEGAVAGNAEKKEQLQSAGAEIMTYGDLQGTTNLHFLLDRLSERGVQQLLVEGGPKILASFLREGLADELCVYIAPDILADRGSADITQQLTGLEDAVSLHNVRTGTFDGDVRISGLTSQGLANVRDK